jgi:hypothetical protein
VDVFDIQVKTRGQDTMAVGVPNLRYSTPSLSVDHVPIDGMIISDARAGMTFGRNKQVRPVGKFALEEAAARVPIACIKIKPVETVDLIAFPSSPETPMTSDMTLFSLFYNNVSRGKSPPPRPLFNRGRVAFGVPTLKDPLSAEFAAMHEVQTIAVPGSILGVAIRDAWSRYQTVIIECAFTPDGRLAVLKMRPDKTSPNSIRVLEFCMLAQGPWRSGGWITRLLKRAIPNKNDA